MGKGRGQMSASNNKFTRKRLVEAGTEKHTLAREKEIKAHRKSNILYSSIGILIVLLFAAVFLYNSSWPSRHATAVTINGEKYTAAQLNYYYSTAYQSFYNNYYTYFSYGYGPFKTDESLARQAYSDTMSWRDYFIQSAVDNMKQIQMLCDQANAAGFKMSDEEQSDYESACSQVETGWSDNGYSSLAQYLNVVYGKGVTIDLVKQEMYRTDLASAYSSSVYNSYQYNTDQQNDYYTQNENDLDNISYAYYYLDESTYKSDSVTADQAADLVSGYAGQITAAVNGTDVDTFNSYLSANFNGASATSNSNEGSSLSSTYSAWLLDASRKAGDAASFESNGSQYVVMFLGRDNNDYQLVNFRHILVKAVDDDGDSKYSDTEVQTSYDTAEKYYQEWLAGAADEDSFASLAGLYTDDTGSKTTGGLYENIHKGQMVDVVNDWLFADGRQPGDTTVVTYNENGSYTGTHVLYFTGFSDMTYAQYLADTAMRNNDYKTWSDNALQGYTAATSNLFLCGKTH